MGQQSMIEAMAGKLKNQEVKFKEEIAHHKLEYNRLLEEVSVQTQEQGERIVEEIEQLSKRVVRQDCI